MPRIAPFRWMSPLLVLLALTPVPVPAQDATDSAPDSVVTLAVGRALALPAVDVPAPAYAEENEGKASERVMLPLADLDPRPEAEWNWPGAGGLRWSTLEASGGSFELGTHGATARMRLLAFRVHTDAFTKATLRLHSRQLLRVDLNGEKVADKSKAEGADEDPGELEAELTLPTGDHVVVVVAEIAGGAEGDWTLEAALEVPREKADRVRVSIDGMRRMKLEDMLDADAPGGLDVSADGSVLALSVSHPAAPVEGRRTWIEFLDTEDGEVLRSLEGVGTLSGFEWAPEDDRHAFVTREKGAATLWIGRFRGGAPVAVLEDLEDMGGYAWMPDGRSIVFSRSEDGPEDPENFKRYRGLGDRWGGFRDLSSLYQVSVPDGIVRRLTEDHLGVNLQDVAPDGSRLLFTRSLRDDATWPFSRAELVELDLRTLEVEVLATEPWGLGAAYGPDGNTIAITGPPQAFDGLGETVDEDVEPNLYETQLYLMDRTSGDVRAVSRDFDPPIDGMSWIGDRDEILVRGTDGGFERLFRYDVGRDRWETLETPVEVVQSTSLSRDGRLLAFRGTGTNVPGEIWTSPVRSWNPRRIKRFEPERFDAITFGRVEDYDHEINGETLVGRIYYPPHFDPEKKWPVIVYYYGGTVPVTRTFGGRYPKEWWAAQGYLVYVMQPSGAVGFGQEFAARHVNNWGKTVADEIIEATKGFLADHEYADPDAVGCIGASYGGFMTMLLTTRTDMFSAAVSHAGISSISSYWGEGNWGFSYSAAATAKSYPWNRPDIYVDQSALFNADKIHTPLLLLHGGDDDNVPPGESEQLYTALRVLGREVEYIRIAGERHWILQYDKRVRWSQSIVAWFDEHLKGDGSWWDELWPSDEEDED